MKKLSVFILIVLLAVCCPSVGCCAEGEYAALQEQLDAANYSGVIAELCALLPEFAEEQADREADLLLLEKYRSLINALEQRDYAAAQADMDRLIRETSSEYVFPSQPIDEAEDSSETNELKKNSISEAETFTMFNAAFNALDDLVDDFSDTLEYDNFSSVSEIEDYENLWADMSNKAKRIQTTFLENSPPEKYKELWDDYGDCMSQISQILAQGTDMDTNQDGNYTGAEMSSHISNIKDNFVAEASEAIDVFKKFTEQYDGKTISSSNNSKNNNQSSQTPTTPKEYCTVCSSPASRTYTNPFSTEKEKYCETHYQEIIDVMNMLEADYEKSTNSTKDPDKSSYSSNGARHTDSEAFTCAKAVVESKLKSPSTAKFCWITDATITHLGNGEYMVTGWVDAQNSFGAVIRQNFVVVYTATEKGYKNGEAVLY